MYLSYIIDNKYDDDFFSPQARMFELDTIRGKYGINVIMFKVYGTYVDINGNKSTF